MNDPGPDIEAALTATPVAAAMPETSVGTNSDSVWADGGAAGCGPQGVPY